jgi:hypothetical protein
MLLVTDQSEQRSADKQQELGLFSGHMIEALTTKLYFCKFTPFPRLVL